MSTSGSIEHTSAAPNRVAWRALAIALAWSLVSTFLVGWFLLLLLDNIWWGAAVAVAALFGGGFYVGDKSGEAEPLYGAMLTGAYFVIVVVVVFTGTALEVFTDPYPGLDRGDSTFFFVAPLLLLVGGVAGSVVGGGLSQRDAQDEETVE